MWTITIILTIISFHDGIIFAEKNIFIHPAKVNVLNLGFNGKISHRRSLNAEILPIVMDRPNLTVIDLGSKASGVYVPKAKSNDSEICVRIEDL